MIFDKMEGVRDYLRELYPKIKGRAMACWITSDTSMCIGVYEGEDMVKGLLVYRDLIRDRWILLDNLFADLATRNFVAYREEFDEAVTFFELEDLMKGEEEKEENDEDLFFTDLD